MTLWMCVMMSVSRGTALCLHFLIFSCFPFLRLLQVCVSLTSPSSLRIRRLNSFPSIHRKSSPGCRMPHLVAMARAVLMLSPVTMRTVIPARWHFLMASGTWWEHKRKRQQCDTCWGLRSATHRRHKTEEIKKQYDGKNKNCQTAARTNKCWLCGVWRDEVIYAKIWRQTTWVHFYRLWVNKALA